MNSITLTKDETMKTTTTYESLQNVTTKIFSHDDVEEIKVNVAFNRVIVTRYPSGLSKNVKFGEKVEVTIDDE